MHGGILLMAAAIAASVPVEVTLRGSPESMQRQHAVARQLDLPAAESRADMERLAREGALVAVYGGEDYEVAEWVNPYAIPQVRLFVERLARQYREACGERLVVTSLTRPRDEQPPNAHDLSVHPMGMAADFRIPQNPRCREWIEAAFLNLENEGVIDATRERAPPHYHVAVFPQPYARFAAARQAQEVREEPAEGVPPGGGGGVSPGGPVDPDPLPGGSGAGVTLLIAILAFAVAAAVIVGAAKWAARRSRSREV
jgi:hypothetical protein